jgi:hypothetical protein
VKTDRRDRAKCDVQVLLVVIFPPSSDQDTFTNLLVKSSIAWLVALQDLRRQMQELWQFLGLEVLQGFLWTSRTPARCVELLPFFMHHFHALLKILTAIKQEHWKKLACCDF